VRIALLLLALAFVRVCSGATDADALLKRAISLAASGHLDEAEHLLQEGRSSFARDARFPVELAGVALRKKQLGRAKAYLRQGLRLDPSDAYANQFLGSLYLLDGNVHAALKYWNRVRLPVLNDIAFSPEPPLRPELIARIPAVSAGQMLTEARLQQTERNLDRLRIFSDPSFELTPAANNEYDLTIRSQAQSQPLSGVIGRVLPLVRGLPYQQANLDWLNIGRRAIMLTSLWRWDPDKRRIAAMYRAPLTHGSYAIWTDLRDEDWDLQRTSSAFNVKSAELGGEIAFDLGGGKQWTPSIHLSRHTFRKGEFRNSTIWELRNRFDLARWQYPERRIRFDSSVTLRAGRVFSAASSRLLGAEFDASMRWFPQQRDDLYAVGTRLRAGAITGQIPVDELYITAMERDNNLWLRGHSGTQHGRKGSAPMGTRFVLSQTDVTRRLWSMPFLRIDAGPFVDLANTGGVPSLGSRGWLYDAGAQAVVKTMGGFRLSVVYGRDMRDGNNVFYTAISR
jgi:hypothetical protein